MNSSANRLLVILFIVLLAPFCLSQSAGFYAVAQDNKDETEAYKAWYDANAGKDYQKAVDFAKVYLEKFPTGKYAEYLKGWVVQIRSVLLPGLFNQARQAKNITEEIKLGQEALAKEPENLDYLYLMVVDIRTNELLINPPSFTHAAEATDFTLRAIKLIEAGKVPNVVTKDQWNQKASLAFLYHTLATIEKHNRNLDKAIEYNAKSISLDAIAPNYALTCGAYQQEKYAVAAQKYESFPAAERQGETATPEAKATLEEANRSADAMIDCWAKFLALTENNNSYKATREKVQSTITELYKYRHPDTPDGLQKLIESYRSTTPPAPSAQ
jgi:hypothetical protein